MANKTKIRSVRFSEEMCEIIEQQVGENFSQKFERMVYNCYILQSEKEKKLAELDQQIEEKKLLLNDLSTHYSMFRSTAVSVAKSLEKIEEALAKL